MATFDLPPLLIKFGEEKDINRLVFEGSMKFGTFAEYREIPSDKKLINLPGRYDKFEGLQSHYEGEAKIKFKGIDNSMNLNEAKLNFFQSEYKNIFCAYGASHNLHKNFRIDHRMKEYFGEYAVIFNSKNFLIHISNLLYGTRFHMGFVKYYPEKEYFNNLGAFSKRDDFKFQYEYRIATNLSSKIINIGDFLNKQPDTHIVKSDALLQAKFIYK